MAAGATQFLEGDLLAGHRLDHVRAGDEHVGLLADHEDEVGHGRAVDGAACTRSEDHAYLGDHARGLDVAPEDAAIAVKADHALLNTSPRTVVEANHRGAHAERQVHDLVDLLGEHLTEGPAEHCEVLGKQKDLPAVDGPPSGDDPVGVGALLDTALVRPVTGQHVEFMEGARVKQIIDPFARQHLSLVTLALDCPLGARVDCRLAAFT